MIARPEGVTGWCVRDDHDSCGGQLRAGITGWRWFCVCPCHPEPAVARPEHKPAVAQWRKDRAALVGTEVTP